MKTSVYPMKIADKETFDLLERVAAKRCGNHYRKLCSSFVEGVLLFTKRNMNSRHHIDESYSAEGFFLLNVTFSFRPPECACS